MRASVRAAFVAFTSAFEGVVDFLYLDVKGLVTVGIGNLVDPIDAALTLPLVYKGTEIPAPREAIIREWNRVKSHPTAAKQGHRVLAADTSLRLTEDGIRQVVERKLMLNETLLEARFPGWHDWPADAQLATLSMAWACGPMFAFPRLAEALRAQDFARAERECHMNEAGNPGLIPRNIADKTLYRNAAIVLAEGLDVERLYFPRDLTETPPSVIRPEQLLEEPAIVHPKVPLPERE